MPGRAVCAEGLLYQEVVEHTRRGRALPPPATEDDRRQAARWDRGTPTSPWSRTTPVPLDVSRLAAREKPWSKDRGCRQGRYRQGSDVGSCRARLTTQGGAPWVAGATSGTRDRWRGFPASTRRPLLLTQPCLGLAGLERQRAVFLHATHGPSTQLPRHHHIYAHPTTTLPSLPGSHPGVGTRGSSTKQAVETPDTFCNAGDSKDFEEIRGLEASARRVVSVVRMVGRVRMGVTPGPQSPTSYTAQYDFHLNH